MAEEKYSYEKLKENGEVETAGEYTIDHDGSHVEQFYCGEKAFMVMDGELSEITGHSAEDFDFYTHSFHFPYGRLEALQGVRHDDNGYTYYLVKSDDDTSYEFVAGTQMRPLRLSGILE